MKTNIYIYIDLEFNADLKCKQNDRFYLPSSNGEGCNKDFTENLYYTLKYTNY